MSDVVKLFAILVWGPRGSQPAWVIVERNVSIAGERAVVYDFILARGLDGAASLYSDRDGDVLASNEGITWCRGWHGPIADAFRTSVAL